MKEIFITTASQIVLEYLCKYPRRSFYDSEMAREIKKLSLASVNNVLKDLAGLGLIERKRQGKQVYNSVNLEHPLIKRFKVFLNFLELDKFLEEVKLISDKIIVYGSSITGDNTEKSDIDILVVSEKDFVKFQQLIEKHCLEEKVQLIIKKPAEYLRLKEKEPIFYEEVHRGVIYYER